MLKIKKQYKQADGTLIEVEGDEAEIEAFEKKQRKQKAQIESESRKKTILYGKELEDLIRRIAAEEAAKATPKVEHHWHYDWRPWNGYYWRPLWDGVSWTYQYSTAANPGDGNYTVCNSAADLSSAIGISEIDALSATKGTALDVITSGGCGDPLAEYRSFIASQSIVSSGQTWSGAGLDTRASTELAVS
jgi:hypothetical protein